MTNHNQFQRARKQNIGSNGHENSTLLRLLPLMVGSSIPEGDKTCTMLIDLKEIVQLVLSPSFKKESIQYSKMSDHRQSLKAVFPHFPESVLDLWFTFGP